MNLATRRLRGPLLVALLTAACTTSITPVIEPSEDAETAEDQGFAVDDAPPVAVDRGATPPDAGTPPTDVPIAPPTDLGVWPVDAGTPSPDVVQPTDVARPVDVVRPADVGAPMDVSAPPIDAGGPAACGASSDCARGEFCSSAACDGPGRCEARPTGCATVYLPVCGCDGRTYGNTCEAAGAGARVRDRGVCPADAGAPDAGPADVARVDVPPGTCRANADCTSAQYCAGTGCGTVGACATRPRLCNDLYSPVCGCDGVTYGNACNAQSAGVRVNPTGECRGLRDAGLSPCALVRCVSGQACCDNPRSATYGRCYDLRCLSCCM